MPLLLPSFPFLSPTEFKAACVSFEERYRNHRRRDAGNVKTGLGIGGWRDVRVYERVCTYNVPHMSARVLFGWTGYVGFYEVNLRMYVCRRA